MHDEYLCGRFSLVSGRMCCATSPAHCPATCFAPARSPGLAPLVDEKQNKKQLTQRKSEYLNVSNGNRSTNVFV